MINFLPVILLAQSLNFLFKLVQLLSGVIVVVVLHVLVSLRLVQLGLDLAQLGLGELKLGLDLVLLSVGSVQTNLELLNLGINPIVVVSQLQNSISRV